MSRSLQRPVIDRRGQNEAVLIKSLAEVIWGLPVQEGSREAKFYLEFYNARTGVLDIGIFFPRTHEDVVSLIDIIKEDKDHTLTELSQHLVTTAAQLPWLKSTDEIAIQKVVKFGASIWLMIDTKGWQDDESLLDFVHKQFPSPSPIVRPHPDVTELQFNGRMLHQVGGMEIIWTSDIREHLRIIEDAVFVFRHASYLSRSQTSPEMHGHLATTIPSRDRSNYCYTLPLLRVTAEALGSAHTKEG